MNRYNDSRPFQPIYTLALAVTAAGGVFDLLEGSETAQTWNYNVIRILVDGDDASLTMMALGGQGLDPDDVHMPLLAGAAETFGRLPDQVSIALKSTVSRTVYVTVGRGLG